MTHPPDGTPDPDTGIATEDGPAPPPMTDRELSWLAFNGRVLQEAADPRVPLFERLGFLAIFSSNLDEFFRVRVASLRSLLRLKKKKVRRLSLDPHRLLREIHRVVHRQQEAFGILFREMVPELARLGLRLKSDGQLDARERAWVEAHVRDTVLPDLHPIRLAADAPAPFLWDRHVYLVVELWGRGEGVLPPAEYALVPIPSPPHDRFLVLPEGDPGEGHTVMFLDDALRVGLPHLFPEHHVGGAYAVKLSRDAELTFEDEFAGDVVEAIRKSLAKRETGVPSRFLYDMRTPFAVVRLLHDTLGLEDDDMVVGGRYHNLHDLRSFPRTGVEGHVYERLEPLPHPELSGAPSVMQAVAAADQLLHFPYQSYDHVVRFLTEAAEDPTVEEIWLTVYRVSEESRVLAALLEAQERGKKVNVFVEVKARFDEASNVAWADRLRAAGVVTFFSSPELKVHAKIALVVRREDGGSRRYAYLGTGNFNEDTARFYTDFALLTADPRLATEVERVFHALEGTVEDPTFDHLMVAPFNLREEVVRRIRREADRAREGLDCGITIKMNALEDDDMIAELHAAAEAGVPLRGIVRGICRMRPPAHGSVRFRSVVDRYLEHGRAYVFHGTDGPPEVFLASADWMHRNLSRRVEVAFPVYDPFLRDQVLEVVRMQLDDHRKGRLLDAEGRNLYDAFHDPDVPGSQARIRSWLAQLPPRTRS